MFSYKVIASVLLSVALISGCSDEEAVVTDSDKAHVIQQSSQTVNSQKLDILDISEREYGDINSIALLFNTPLETDQSFDAYISVDPTLSNPILSQDGRTLHFTGVKPVVDYEITLRAGIKAVNGTIYDGSQSKKLKSRALPSVVSFKEDGAIMIPGKVDALSIIAVNVSEADINVYKVKRDKTVSFFNEYSALSDNDRWYYDESQLEKTLDHVYASRLKISTTKNQRNYASFPVNLVPEIDQGGIYFATIRVPGSFEFQSTWFSVSSLGIQSRDYGKQTRYITQDASNGQILADVKIDILDYNNKVIATGVTNADGAWDVDNAWKRNSPRYIVARKDNFVSVLNYHAPSLDLSGFSLPGRKAKPLEYFVYSPRDIYRPGEELILSSLMRDMDGQLLDGSLKVELVKPDGESAGQWRLDATVPGYFEFHHSLADNAPLGEWLARIYSTTNAGTETRFRFKVEEFLPERLRLVFDGDKDPFSSFELGESVSVNVKGEYLYGAPAAGNKLDTQVSINGWAEPFDKLKGFSFGDPDKVQWDQFSLASSTLDDKGELITAIGQQRLNWKNFETPTRLRLRYSLYESGGRAINRNKSVLLWPRKSFIGVKPHFTNDTSKTDHNVNFDLVRANSRGQMLTAGEVKATLYRLEENYFWSHTPERGWHYQVEKNEYPVNNQVLDFDGVESLTLSVPVEWGRYRLELDDYEGSSRTVYRFQAGDSWYYNWNNASNNSKPDRVTVALNKPRYTAGDIAKVKLVSPTSGTAIVLLETDRVLKTIEVELVDREAEVEIAIPEDLKRHDAYVTAFVIAPTDQTEKVSKRSFGIAHLSLDRSDRRLVVDIDVADKLLPEHAADIYLKVNDSQGVPVEAQDLYVTLSAVDSGVLSVTGYQQADPFAYFYGQRRYQPSITDMYDDLAEPVLSDKAEIRWGGDGELERGGEAPPSDVQIISLFQGPVKVEQGIAHIRLQLPAFDGELTLNAVAMAGDKFGKQTEITKVAAPVVAQLSMPRFMAQGDKAALALDLANMSGEHQSISVLLSSSDHLRLDNEKFELQLDEGKKQILQLPVTATLIGEGQLSAEISLRSDDGTTVTLEREWLLGVRAAYPAQFDSENKFLSKGDQFDFPTHKLDQLLSNSIVAQMRVSTTPDLGASKHFDLLTRYPYACLEQTTSKSQPIALLLENKKLPVASASFTSQEIDRQLKVALSRYSELQRANGSFGLWHRQSSEEHWLTAYATDFLLRINDAGVTVSDEMLNNALQRLSHYVHKRSALTVNTWSDIPSHYEIAYKSFAAYVLAKQGRVTLGPLRDLAENQLDNARSSLPGVHLGLAMIETGSTPEGEELVLTAMKVQRTPGYLGDYGSIIRDMAMGIHIILDSKAASTALKKQALQKIPDLLIELKQQRWLSTQERTALLNLSTDLAATDLEGEWRGELDAVTGKEVLMASGTVVRNLEAAGTQSSFTNQSLKPLFVSYSWTGIPASPPASLDEGIRVRVEHFKVENANASILREGQVLNIGDTVLTRVRFYSETRVPDGLIVGLIPAGVELENQNLKNAFKLENIKLEGRNIQSRSRLAYEAFKDDRYVAAVDIPAKQEQTLYYLSRAVTPGSYTVPPVLAESMYKPSIRGISNSIKSIVVMP